MTALTTLSPADASTARLPATYEAARNALAECERIDECKSWADKAAALASYGRQANDDEIFVLGRRIQARALRRAGELLKQIEPAHGANQNISIGTDTKVITRTSAATEAGFSKRQKVTALRVASIPEAEFTRQVESPTPPTVTALADQGRASRDWGGQTSPWAAIESAEAREGCATLEAFAAFCSDHEPKLISRAVSAAEVEALRPLMASAGEWIARLAEEFADEQ